MASNSSNRGKTSGKTSMASRQNIFNSQPFRPIAPAPPHRPLQTIAFPLPETQTAGRASQILPQTLHAFHPDPNPALSHSNKRKHDGEEYEEGLVESRSSKVPKLMHPIRPEVPVSQFTGPNPHPTTTSLDMLDDKVKASAAMATESLTNALRADLQPATLHKDMNQYIVKSVTTNWFLVQYRSWFINFTTAQNINKDMASKSLETIDQAVKEQAYFLGLAYDRQSSALKDHLSGDEMFHWLQQKPHVIADQQTELLTSWANKWAAKLPYQSYLLENHSAGAAASDKANKHNNETALDTNNARFSSPPASDLMAPGLGQSFDHHSQTKHTPRTDDQYRTESPNTRSKSKKARTLQQGDYEVKKTAPTSSQRGSQAKNTTRNADTQGPNPFGKADIFDQHPSSQLGQLVPPNMPVRTIISRFPNHLTLHHNAIRLVDEKWTIKEVADGLVNHSIRSEFRSQYQGKQSALWSWVKRQREKATHHRKNAQRKQDRLAGRPVIIQPRPRRNQSPKKGEKAKVDDDEQSGDSTITDPDASADEQASGPDQQLRLPLTGEAQPSPAALSVPAQDSGNVANYPIEGVEGTDADFTLFGNHYDAANNIVPQPQALSDPTAGHPNMLPPTSLFQDYQDMFHGAFASEHQLADTAAPTNELFANSPPLFESNAVTNPNDATAAAPPPPMTTGVPSATVTDTAQTSFTPSNDFDSLFEEIGNDVTLGADFGADLNRDLDDYLDANGLLSGQTPSSTAVGAEAVAQTTGANNLNNEQTAADVPEDFDWDKWLAEQSS